MAKIARKLLAHFINGTPASTATYALLGCDLEEYNTSMNDNVESTQNICGGSSVNITNGTRQGDVDPYYADSGTDLFNWLQDIIDSRKELDDRQTDTVDVHQWETPSGALYPAVKRDVRVEIASYGGDTDGYQIPFNLHHTGDDVIGAFDPTTKAFTAGSWDGTGTSGATLSGVFTATP